MLLMKSRDFGEFSESMLEKPETCRVKLKQN
jgi:hypothetical protein